MATFLGRRCLSDRGEGHLGGRVIAETQPSKGSDGAAPRELLPSDRDAEFLRDGFPADPTC